MAKYGFLSVLEKELDKRFQYDYAINWDKKNHAVEVSFILEAQNSQRIQTLDKDGLLSDEDIALEEFILFYNPQKSQFDSDDYLVALPFDTKKGLSQEFLAYFSEFLNEVATQGLDDMIDFLLDEDMEEFSMTWDSEAFVEGCDKLEETIFYPYPRY